jgi:hypothetical protein
VTLLETDLHQDNAADNTNHRQRHSEQAQDQCRTRLMMSPR